MESNELFETPPEKGKGQDKPMRKAPVSKTVPVTELVTMEPFSKLFRIREEILVSIADSMRSFEYDPAYPVIVWILGGQMIVVDGHTRLSAAKICGITDVPVIMYEFDNELEAIEHALHIQRDRRNLTDAELITCATEIDRLMQRGGDRRSAEAKGSSGPNKVRSADKTAKDLGTSGTKIKKIRTILREGGDEIGKKVLTGDVTINQAYQEVMTARKLKAMGVNNVFTRATTGECYEFKWRPIRSTTRPDEEEAFKIQYRRSVKKTIKQMRTENQLTLDGKTMGEELAKLNDELKEKTEKYVLVPERLIIPALPEGGDDGASDPEYVLVSPALDLFDTKASDAVVQVVLDSIRKASQYIFLVMTDNFGRAAEYSLPNNCFIGAVITNQADVVPSMDGLRKIDAMIRFAVIEPEEPVAIDSFKGLNWVVVNKASDDADMPDRWAESLLWQSRNDRVPVFVTPGVPIRPTEKPEQRRRRRQGQGDRVR